METQKFKANPYNFSNHLITKQEVIDILNRVNINDFKPTNLKLYQTAFVHKSYNLLEDYKEYKQPDNCLPLQKESYETLEFLGDSLLGCMTAEYLYKRFDGEDEGFMTRLQTKIEDKKNLAVFSKHLGLGKYFLLSKQIESLNGRNLDRIHEDVFEAFMGALFLSNGLEPASMLLFNLLETLVDYSDKLYCDNNYKDNLLRYHHKKKWALPVYHMIHFDGHAHKRTYIMRVEKANLDQNQKKEYIKNKTKD